MTNSPLHQKVALLLGVVLFASSRFFPRPLLQVDKRVKEPRLSLWNDFSDSANQVGSVSSAPHIVVELLRSGSMKKLRAAEVSPSVRGETVSAACLFSIFKVPSLLLRDATVGEVRKYQGGAINPGLTALSACGRSFHLTRFQYCC